MGKLIRDGKVAVLVSVNYGAGWSSWANSPETAEDMLFNERIALAVIGDSGETPMEAAEAEFPEEYKGGVEHLTVEWVEQGARFRIDEYDGYETLVLDYEDSWRIA